MKCLRCAGQGSGAKWRTVTLPAVDGGRAESQGSICPECWEAVEAFLRVPEVAEKAQAVLEALPVVKACLPEEPPPGIGDGHDTGSAPIRDTKSGPETYPGLATG